MTTLLYFAYGSNLHPVRLTARVPSARFIACASLTGHVLKYHKRGACGSGKCNAFPTGNAQDVVLGAIYQIAEHEKRLLDAHEGEGYACHDLQIEVEQATRTAFAYIASDAFIDDTLRPYTWYQALVERGARYQSFPDTYIETYISIASHPDPDPARHARHRELLARMGATRS